MRLVRTIITAITLAVAATAAAIDTQSLQLRNGSINDGEVSLTRDADGNLFFDDAFTTAPISLSTILSLTTDHGALLGLSDDDHAQYLNALRHEAAHDATFDNALPISGDVNGNQSIGEHVSDGAIHLKRAAAEEITAPWNFADGLRVHDNDASLGQSQYGTAMALGFADGVERAEITYDTAAARFLFNRDATVANLRISGILDGRVASIRTGTIEGFATIEGIAPTDLLSSTQQESVSAEWTFLGGVRANRITQTGLPTIVYTVENSGGTIVPGDAVRWSGIASGMPTVEKLTSAITASTPFAGIATSGGVTGASIQVARSGVVELPATGTFAVGDELTWNGSAATTGGTRIGFALQSHSGSSTTSIMLSGGW